MHTKPDLPQMNRIEQRFARLRRDDKKGMVIYIGAGDPDLASTRELALVFDRVGVDVLELGVPFSDPLADGPVNQLSAQRGLASGTTPGGVLATVQQIRQDSPIPIVLYIYFNLVHRYGCAHFIRDAAEAGVDGLLVLDLPPEESGEYERQMEGAGLCPIYLIAPTTPDTRIATICGRARGFLYYVSREGVTGMQSEVAANLVESVQRIRRHTELPIAVGFGVSNAEQARLVAGSADAVVVGSAVVQQIAVHGGSPQLSERVGGFVRDLVEAVKVKRVGSQ